MNAHAPQPPTGRLPGTTAHRHERTTDAAKVLTDPQWLGRASSKRAISCLTGYRRLTVRHERRTDNYCGLLTRATAQNLPNDIWHRFSQPFRNLSGKVAAVPLEGQPDRLIGDHLLRFTPFTFFNFGR
ncbi:hypothetical protein ACFXGA_30675 [Actinosynnema sp. NPDC059335]|uniref:hypothetical protein n=1 Tax=Actinosynnema sp. NPDC059335 TaxID=3346804 RepID=UPI00366CD018